MNSPVAVVVTHFSLDEGFLHIGMCNAYLLGGLGILPQVDIHLGEQFLCSMYIYLWLQGVLSCGLVWGSWGKSRMYVHILYYLSIHSTSFVSLCHSLSLLHSLYLCFGSYNYHQALCWLRNLDACHGQGFCRSPGGTGQNFCFEKGIEVSVVERLENSVLVCGPHTAGVVLLAVPDMPDFPVSYLSCFFDGSDLSWMQS